MKSATKSYLDKAKKLSTAEQERLLSRMTGKLPKRLLKDRLSREEALAIQLELEDEQLQEWRLIMSTLKSKSPKDQNKDAKLNKSETAAKNSSKSNTAEAKAKKTISQSITNSTLKSDETASRKSTSRLKKA